MSSYRHQNRQHFHRQQPQPQFNQGSISPSTSSLPQFLSPQVATGLLLALFVLPLLLLFLSQSDFGFGFGFDKGGEWKEGMFRTLGLGLVYGKWNGSGSGRREWDDDDESSDGGEGEEGIDGGKKKVKFRRSDSVQSSPKHRKSSSSHQLTQLKLKQPQHYPGLINISGTYCFLNSIVQSLASLSYLKPYLDKVQERAEELDVPTPVVDALRDAFIGE